MAFPLEALKLRRSAKVAVGRSADTGECRGVLRSMTASTGGCRVGGSRLIADSSSGLVACDVAVMGRDAPVAWDVAVVGRDSAVAWEAALVRREDGVDVLGMAPA